MNDYIRVQDVSMWFPVRKGFLFGGKPSYVKAVDHVSLSIKQGSILGIIGESGCGKSTLGRVLTYLLKPTSGDVFIDGQSAARLIEKDPKSFRRLVQIVFQNPYDSFTPKDTIEKILLRPLRIHNIGKDDDERRRLCLKRLEKGGLHPAEEIMQRYPHQLSGGQLQRISIIRSMLLEPKVIIADEPVSMLDVSVRADIINMLLSLSRENNATVIFISHDISLTRYISDHIAVMYLGKIVEYGKSDEVIQHPGHPYTKVLISNCGSIYPEDYSEKIKVSGEPPTPVDLKSSCYFAPRCYMAKDSCFHQYPVTVELGEGHLVCCDRVHEGGIENI